MSEWGDALEVVVVALVVAWLLIGQRRPLVVWSVPRSRLSLMRLNALRRLHLLNLTLAGWLADVEPNNWLADRPTDRPTEAYAANRDRIAAERFSASQTSFEPMDRRQGAKDFGLASGVSAPQRPNKRADAAPRQVTGLR